MNKRTIAALAELSSALYAEAGSGDATLVVNPKIYNAVVPQDWREVGFTEYVVMAPGGRIAIHARQPERTP